MENNSKKIYFLGPEGSYTQIAAKLFCEKLGLEGELEPVSSITRAMVDFRGLSVLPIENSIEGIVRESIDNMLKLPEGVQILSQCVIDVRHCLISKGNLGGVKNIISHPQAISQCQGWILENFKEDANIVNAASTSQATKMLLELDKSWASIANELCAQHWGLSVVAKNINDNPDNQTRFMLLGKGAIGAQERTSIAFSTQNKPGALLEVLEVFKAHNLNMLYIESRPSKRVFGEYVFYVDLDAGANSIVGALEEIKGHCNFYRLLGSYFLA
jgi:prephenate dehydratase